MAVPDIIVASMDIRPANLDERVGTAAILLGQVAAHDGSAVRPEP